MWIDPAMDLALVERVARRICNRRGIDPDALCCDGSPQTVIGGCAYFIGGPVIPAWRLFLLDAVAAIEEVSKKNQDQGAC